MIGAMESRAPLDLVARCDRRLERVEAELVVASGDASLCALSRSGRPVPAVKHLEGRSAALREVSRAIRTGGAEGTPGLVAERRRVWADALADLEARAAGPDWLAYRTGGVDELDALLDEAGRNTTDGEHVGE